MRRSARRLAVGTCAAAALLLAATSASAIPYFNAPVGFDNTTLDLMADYEIAADSMFPPIGPSGTDVTLNFDEVMNDTPGVTNIDRTITWHIVNTVPNEVDEMFLFLTMLGPTDFDFSNVPIDIGIDSGDPMDIAVLGPYTVAGYFLTLDDFDLVDGELTANRTFRYTVGVPQPTSGPPALGIAYSTEILPVPEPTTGALLVAALLVAATAGRTKRIG